MPLPILLLSDGRPGHYHLAEGVIAAIAKLRPVAVTRLTIRRRRWMPGRVLARLASPPLPPGTALTAGYGLSREALGHPALIVSAGGDTIAASADAARVTGARNIFCGSLRRISPSAFSLIISSYAEHAGLPNHIVTLKPSPLAPQHHPQASSQVHLGPQHPPEQAGLLVGGNSGLFRYEQSDWDRLIAFVHETHTRNGTRWHVSSSPRSPAAISDRLAELAAMPGSPIAQFVDFRSAGPSSLAKVLEPSQAIVCTGNSSTMMSEAIGALLPVVGVYPQHYDFKPAERQYRELMRARNWARFVPLAELTAERFLEELAAVQPMREDPARALAANIRARLPELFLDAAVSPG